MATSVKDGVAPGQELPVAMQAGGTATWDDWTFRAAAQCEAALLSGGVRWGLGAGLTLSF